MNSHFPLRWSSANSHSDVLRDAYCTYLKIGLWDEHGYACGTSTTAYSFWEGGGRGLQPV